MSESTIERGVDIPHRIDALNGETSATYSLIIFHNHTRGASNAAEQHYTVWASAHNEELYMNVDGTETPRLAREGAGPNTEREAIIIGQAYHALPRTSICKFCYEMAQKKVSRVVLKESESEE